jgi:hypothetical protein
MFAVHALLLRAAADGAADAAIVAGLAPLRDAIRAPLAEWNVHRGLRTSDVYVYFVLASASSVGDAEVRRLEAIARELPLLLTAPAIDRLERVFATAGASAAQSAPFHYVVETDPAEGWADELSRWYDTEHMPGLAAVPGCVRTLRFRNADQAPCSLASYDLTNPAVLESASWLAVRRTPWSDRVRPQFRNTRRTMFRTLCNDGAICFADPVAPTGGR